MFPLLEFFRADLSKQREDVRMPILDYKADWPALVEVTGLRTWSHNLHCCPCCLARKRDLDKLAGFSSMTCPFPLYDNGLYAATLATNFMDASPEVQSFPLLCAA